MKKRANDGVSFSHAEFDALPHSVQRKYFSSLERLRISEQQSIHLQESESSRRSSHSHSHSHSVLHHPLTLGLTLRRRLRKAESVRIETDVAHQDAEFFLSLPPKIQRQHFSREEQVVLGGRCDGDQPFHPKSADLQRAQQRFHDFQFFDFDADSSRDCHSERGRPRRRSRSISPTRSPRRRGDPDAANANAATHLHTMNPTHANQQARPQPASFRRTLSLSNMPVPARYSTSSVPLLSTDPPLVVFAPQNWNIRSTSLSRPSMSLSRSGRRSSHTPTAPVFDPEATHYQDPEARKKLRMFLGSAQKFDEAVEFGFPSTAAGDDTIAPRYQLPPITTDARNFSRDMQTFLRDDRVSFLDSDEDDDDSKLASDAGSLTDIESPVTPSSAALSFGGHVHLVSPSALSSLDSPGSPPVNAMFGRMNREMTLRMTLTRPDLRADEEKLYGWQTTPKTSSNDPFALEELHLSDDMTGSRGAFAVKPKPHGNLVSRLLKRASRIQR